MSFSGKVKARFIETIIDLLNRAEIETMFIEYDITGYRSNQNKQQNMNYLIDNSPEEILDQLINEKSFSLINSNPDRISCIRLRSQLHLDGFELSNTRLIQIEPFGYTISQIDSYILSYLSIENDISKNHLEQALENFEIENYESANSQIRTCYESFIIHFVNNKYNQNNNSVPNALTVLNQQEYLDEDELKQFKAFWHSIQSNGSHPGISNYEESLFRLHQLLTIIRYIEKKNNH